MNEQQKKIALLAAIVLVAIAAIVFSAVRSSGNGETITKYTDVPPKGIGRHERE